MQLTPPQPPPDDEIEALRIGLSGDNKGHTGPQRIVSFIKDDDCAVRGGIHGGEKRVGAISGHSKPTNLLPKKI